MSNAEIQYNIPKNQPKVAILMGVYNGQTYLKEQMESFLNQDMTDWTLWVSDDGSTDGTWNFLENYQSKSDGRIHLVKGPKEGFVKNFLSLVCNPEIKALYYAYSDQDDIWHNDKLSKAVAWLDTIPQETPALYGAMSCMIDEQGQELGLSLKFSEPFNFKNAIVQNVAAGNTMVFNQAACNLLRKAGYNKKVACHDWWTYILVAACGGQINIDSTPVLQYRQHSNNVIGSNNNLAAKFNRLKELIIGNLQKWNTHHIIALQPLLNDFTAENRKTFDLFIASRDKSLFPRLIDLKRSGIYRKTIWGNLSLIFAALLKKM